MKTSYEISLELLNNKLDRLVKICKLYLEKKIEKEEFIKEKKIIYSLLGW